MREPLAPYLKKKRSALGGIGLYTTIPIKKGTYVIEYSGEKITQEEADRRGGRYLFEINSRWTVDGKDRKNTSRYINHSCTPNCEARIKKGRILLYSIKDIPQGSELSFDYGKEYLKDKDTMPQGCLCPKCMKKKSKNELVKKEVLIG